jgi:hypothetical protein
MILERGGFMVRLRHVGSFALALALVSGTGASAAVTTYQPNPSDLGDLEHHSLYTWRIDNVDPNNLPITSATISIHGISNWDNSPNILFMHLLDTAKSSGVSTFIDDPHNLGSDVSPPFIDDFVNTRYHNMRSWPVPKGTADTFLTSPSFSTKPTDFTYTFNAAQLQALNAYVANGHDLALGFDPDCHFFNSGVKFTITTAAVPEPSAIILLGGGILGLFFRRRALRRRTLDLAGEGESEAGVNALA